MNVTARKYNPGFLSDEAIVASFCVRTNEFESIVEMLSDCRGSSNPHQIVIGPRGSGKTSLLLRVAAEIRGDAVLSSGFFPIVFAEESYEVSTAGEFWLECLSRLSVQAPCRDGDPDLHRTYDELRTIADDRTLGERCLAALLDFSDRKGKRLVLFVENLNAMFRDMTDRDAGWRLRKILQTEPRIVLLASATSRFDQIDNPDQALYDLFRITSLRPLETKECAVLWETVSGQDSRPETIQSLRILTGGNPRLFVIVARFGAKLSFRELMVDLLDLVDDHTEYFRSHLELLPAQERRVYLALADLWKPATTKEIADRARIETSKCSAQLARLVERGSVEVAGGTSRRKQYYLSERMYNIYYLLRRPRGPDRLVDSLIRFMESFYSTHQLRDIGVGIAREVPILDGEMRALHETAFAHLLVLPELVEHRAELLEMFPMDISEVPAPTSAPSDRTKPEWSGEETPLDKKDPVHGDSYGALEAAGRKLIERGAALRDQNRPEEALEVFDEVVCRYGESAKPALLDLAAKALVRKADVFWKLKRFEEALAVCEEVVHRYGSDEEPVLRETVAMAIRNKGVALRELNRPKEALATNDEVVRRYGASENPDILVTVARALCDKGIMLSKMSRLQEALAVSDELIRQFGGHEATNIVIEVAKTLCNKGAILDNMNRPEEALAIYDEVVRRYGASNEPAAHEMIAIALLNKGATLGDQNRPKDALSAFEEVVRRFGTSEEPALVGSVALAMSNKGYSLAALDRLEESLATYDDVVHRYETSGRSNILEAVGKALLNKGSALDASSRQEEALAVYDEIVRRFGTNATLGLRDTVVTALCNKGITLGKLNRHEEAVTTYNEIVRRFGVGEEPALVEMVTKSLLNKGYALSALNRLEEALTAYDETILHPGENEKPSILALVANALVKKGLTLVDLKRPEEALVSYDEAISRCGTSTESSVVRLAAQSFLNKGAALVSLGRLAEALKACDEAVRRYGGIEELDLPETVAKALVNKERILLALARPKEALYVCDEVVRRFGEQDAPVLVHMVADALCVKGGALLDLNRPKEALATFGEVLLRSEKAEKTAISELAAKVLVGRGRAFSRLNRPEEALTAYDEVMHRFGEDKQPLFEDLVAAALANKVSIFDTLNRREEALVTHEELVRRMGERAPEYHELIEYSLIEKADFELVCGRHGSAIEAADLVLNKCLPESVENRLRAHFIRAKATLAEGDTSGSEPDIKAILTALPDIGNLPKEHLDALMEFSIQLGPARMRELIEVSPSADLLLPLTTALAQEMGDHPRVAREVEEVARDIQKKLKSMEKDKDDGNLQTDNHKRIRTQPRTSGIIIRDKKNRILPIRKGPVRLAVVGKKGEKSNSWKIWIEKDGEVYFAIREDNPGLKVSLHKSGRQHIKMDKEYWGKWEEAKNYEGPMVTTSAKLVFPGWGMREDERMSEEDKEIWEGNEIEIEAPEKGKLIAVKVFIRAKGQRLRQEDGKSETLAIWRRKDGKEAQLIVCEEAERNMKDVVRRVLASKTFLTGIKEKMGEEILDKERVYTAAMGGPAEEGGNYILTVSVKSGAEEGKEDIENIPLV